MLQSLRDVHWQCRTQFKTNTNLRGEKKKSCLTAAGTLKKVHSLKRAAASLRFLNEHLTCFVLRNEPSYHLQRVRHRTCRWRCGSSGCILFLGPHVVVDGERGLGPGGGSAWLLILLSGGSPESWTSTGPELDPKLHRQKVLRHNRKKTVMARQ